MKKRSDFGLRRAQSSRELSRAAEVIATVALVALLSSGLTAGCGVGSGLMAGLTGGYGAGGRAELAWGDIETDAGPAPLCSVTVPGVTTALVAARGGVEAVPGFGILFSLPMEGWSWVSDKPVFYDDLGGGNYDSISWKDAYKPPTGFEIQAVLRRPPRPAASLAAGDTFVIFKFSNLTYSARTIDIPAPGDKLGTLTITGFWLDGRTVLDPLSAGSGWRPYIQYGGGLAEYSGVDLGGVPFWDPDSLEYELGWHMNIGIELCRGKLGVYLDYGIETIGAPEVDKAAASAGYVSGQELVTYLMRVGLILSF